MTLLVGRSMAGMADEPCRHEPKLNRIRLALRNSYEVLPRPRR